MNLEIYKLLIDNKPLPKGTRIIDRWGNVQLLTEHTLESANRCPNTKSDYCPFWTVGWSDLYRELLPPEEE